MLIEEKHFDNGAKLFVWEITESVDELLGVINFNPFVIEDIFNFGSEKRKLEYLAVRAIIYTMYSTEVGIEYNEDGSPYISDRSVEISITHTGKYAAVLLHPTKRVGIDIERVSERVERVKKRFLSSEELSHIDKDNERTHLTIMWAAKEALYKVIGVKIVEFTEDIIISTFVPYLEGEIVANETCSEAKREYELSYRVYPEFVLVTTVES